jgi:GcrA cell cycle regulator
MEDWTEELVSLLRRLKLDGFSASQIGNRLGRTRNAVIGKWNRLGESIRKTPERNKLNASLGGRAARKTRPVRDVPPKLKPITKLPPPKREPRPAGNPVVLLDLKSHHCRWPHGDPRHDSFRFCGAQREPGSSYCEHHTVRSVQPLWRQEKADEKAT